MKKINNKGMTVVELILSFAILTILVLGLLKLVLDVKESMYVEEIYKDLNEYSNNLNYVLRNDFIVKRVKDVGFRFSGEEECPVIDNALGFCYKFIFEDLSSKVLVFNFETHSISYDHKVYPIPHSEEIQTAQYMRRIYPEGGCAAYGDDDYVSKEGGVIKVKFLMFYRNDVDCKNGYGLDIVHPIAQ